MTIEDKYRHMVKHWVEQTQPEGAGILADQDGVGYYVERVNPKMTRLGLTWQEAAERLGLKLPEE
jgi:hypothetical protein